MINTLRLTYLITLSLIFFITNAVEAKTVNLELTSKEINWSYDNIESQMRAYTFDGSIPSPVLRVREGDIVNIKLTNDTKSKHSHSLDIHGMNMDIINSSGVLKSGESKTYKFRASTAGVFLYHCGSHSQSKHISRGMFGVIIVDPKRDTRHAPDREYVLIQSEIYQNSKNLQKKNPDAVVFNGRINRYDPINDATATGNMLVGKPGERVRIYFANAGPYKDSVLHLKGGIWDRIWLGGHPKNPLVGLSNLTISPGEAHVLDIVSPIEGATQIISHNGEKGDKSPSAIIIFKNKLSPAEDKLGKEGNYIVK